MCDFPSPASALHPGWHAILRPGFARNGATTRLALCRHEGPLHGRRASIEWLPRETILFDGADGTLQREIERAPDAACIGSAIPCFGRAAAGGRFGRGTLHHRPPHPPGRPPGWSPSTIRYPEHSKETGMIIRRLDARAIKEVRPQLATLLLDAVADGHSLGFLAGLDDVQLEDYWSGVEADVARGTRVLLAAERNGLLVGSVQLELCQKPNGSNRAELQKMLVHCTMRRRGIGTALLQAAEIEALSLRRGLLFLDTEAGSGAEHLYRKCGYTRVGELPEYCCTPNGHWRATAIWYKTLFSRVRR